MGWWPFLTVTSLVLIIVAVAFGGWVFLVLLVPVVLAAVGWLVWGTFSRRRADSVAHRPEKPELLGPGGPDDPDR